MSKSIFSRLPVFTLVALAVLQSSAISPLAAVAGMPSEAQMRAALGKANYLSENARMSVSADPKQSDGLIISMFRQEDATDKDCKIDALLIAKTAMDLSAGDVTKVTVCFYSLTMSNWKAVTVRVTDVKAFSGGDVNKDELLKTLDLTVGNLKDTPNQVERFLQAKRSGPSDVVAAIVGDELQIKSSSIDSSTEGNAKIDALQLALTAVPVLRAGVQKITVSYGGGKPDSGRSITFTVSDLKNISKQVQSILAPVVVSEPEGKKSGGDKK